MNRWMLLIALGSVASFAAHRQFTLETRLSNLERVEERLEGLAEVAGRVQDLEQVPVASQEEVGRLEQRLMEVQAELDVSREELERVRAQAACADVLAERVEEFETGLETTLQDLRTQKQDLQQWRTSREASVDTTELDMRLSTLSRGWETNLSDLQELTAQAVDMARNAQTALESLRRETQPSAPTDRWRKIVGPIVQLAGARTVGSGILLEPQVSSPGKYKNWMLTCWHVIRDIQADFDDPDSPIPVTVYGIDGTTHTELAELLEFDADVDIALLQLLTTRPMTYGAKLAPRSRVAELEIFSDIYAVGCPLGNDPIPTAGQVADLRHEVSGDPYWMISAPTYVGNSGGGIFAGHSLELVGVFSKIYTHGTLRPTVVPHMGLVTPIERVYDWLHDVGYGHLEPKDGHARVIRRSAYLNR